MAGPEAGRAGRIWKSPQDEACHVKRSSRYLRLDGGRPHHGPDTLDTGQPGWDDARVVPLVSLSSGLSADRTREHQIRGLVHGSVRKARVSVGPSRHRDAPGLNIGWLECIIKTNFFILYFTLIITLTSF